MPKNDLSIVLCGEAGQGIQTVENLLVKSLKLSQYHVFATKEYMSRVRGGVNSTSIRVSSHPVSAYLDRIDIFFNLGRGITKHLQKRISSQTIMVPDLKENMEAVGVIAEILKLDRQALVDLITGHFSKKGEEIVKKNVSALDHGIETGKGLEIQIELQKDPALADRIIVSGAEAVALGAIAGGCNFISAYPMTPSTGIFTFLSQHAKEFGIISEQAEDEISAINMGLGAWYAGARALCATSGGGFALMVEGVSLSGMLETPIVICLAQRPGPATGLPTRTEQADLNFALYSGHGEFPRLILAPGSLDEAFELSARAFDLADKYQVPVFILTDQYLNDSYYDLPPFDPAKLPVEKHIVRASKDYRRYALTASGISPRGIPGFGEGLVMADSDEHDEDGHITEDLELRKKMVEKRLKKLKAMEQESIPPKFSGSAKYKNLIIGWGSTAPVIEEALALLGRKDTAFLHFSQVYPLPPSAAGILRKAKKRIIIENNATAQFGQLIKQHTGLECEKKILKSDGLPFSVEELAAKITEALRS